MIQEDNRQEYIAAGEQQATDCNAAELLLFWVKEKDQQGISSEAVSLGGPIARSARRRQPLSQRPERGLAPERGHSHCDLCRPGENFPGGAGWRGGGAAIEWALAPRPSPQSVSTMDHSSGGASFYEIWRLHTVNRAGTLECIDGSALSFIKIADPERSRLRSHDDEAEPGGSASGPQY
jgi:hypothetical protein